MVSVFVIVYNIFTTELAKLDPRLIQVLAYQRLQQLLTQTKVRKPNKLIIGQTKYRTFSWLNSFVLLLLLLFLLILVYILLKGDLKIATDTLLQVVCVTITILYQNLSISVIYPQLSDEKLAQDSKIV